MSQRGGHMTATVGSLTEGKVKQLIPFPCSHTHLTPLGVTVSSTVLLDIKQLFSHYALQPMCLSLTRSSFMVP